MRRITAVAATVAASIGLVAPPVQAAAAPTIDVARVTANGGDTATFDAGDRFRLRFSRPIAPPFSFGEGEWTIHVTDATGRQWVLEPGTDGYGVRFTHDGSRIRVESLDTQSVPLVYPLTITETYGIHGRNGVEASVPGSRDVVVD